MVTKLCDANYGGYSYVYRKRRTKTDWAGVGLGDAFKRNLDYYLRTQAQRLFYQAVKKVQMAVAKQTGSWSDSEFTAEVKPQLSPCYTGYPSGFAAHAAIGLTAYLEYRERVRENILSAHLADYMAEPANFYGAQSDPEVYQRMAMVVTETVETRLLLEDLSRLPSASSVEIYRLFSASQQIMQFHSVQEVIRLVVLYGDILTDWQALKLYPETRSLLQNVLAVCTPFLEALPGTKTHELLDLGAEWVRSICACVADYIPKPDDTIEAEGASQPRGSTEQTQKKGGRSRLAKTQGHASSLDEIKPLNGPKPLHLFDPSDNAQRLLHAMFNQGLSQMEKALVAEAFNDARGESVQEILSSFTEAIDKAGGQHASWEDMRSDLLELALRGSGFSESPIEGSPADGHEVSVELGKGQTATGEIFDRPVDLSDDLPAYDELLEGSQPITTVLKRTLYPNVIQNPEVERFRPSGSLDPPRLAVADFALAIFRRHRIREKADRRGRPVLLIACDGSGSLDSDQMNMVKILAAAWLNSTVRSEIVVLAGLYHSGAIRPGVSGPLVQWIYHPQKTPAISRRDAARALVSLPDTGTGVQSDALSLEFMLGEAVRIARGRMIYTVVISDCQWNSSFVELQPGQEEVYSFFESAYQRYSGLLHVTLVALGFSGKTGFEDVLEKVITVPDEQVNDPGVVAEKISVYVASCMRERHKWLVKR